MRSFVLAVLSGALFVCGLALAGLTIPATITGFLDVTGDWNPSILFVMVGGVGVYAPVVRAARRRSSPWLDARFHWPTLRDIDMKLVGGAAVFGVGWGISGYCPGPALASLVAGATPLLVFVLTMLIGIAGARWWQRQGAQ